MKKIQSLFKRDYEGTRLVYDEVVPGSEWVQAGKGRATIKWDGTACLVKDGKLYRRHDRKVSKKVKRRGGPFFAPDCKPAPEGWVACEDAPNQHTGHWPGWLPVGNGPEDKWHIEAFSPNMPDGTYELVGPKIQGNPYNLAEHLLIPHGEQNCPGAPRQFDALVKFFGANVIEGIVWHHDGGRMVKIKRKDFGFPWPPTP